MSSAEGSGPPRTLSLEAWAAYEVLRRLASEAGPRKGRLVPAGDELALALGRLAQALDPAPAAAQLRRLRIGAVSVGRAPEPRQRAFLATLGLLVDELRPQVVAPAATAEGPAVPAATSVSSVAPAAASASSAVPAATADGPAAPAAIAEGPAVPGAAAETPAAPSPPETSAKGRKKRASTSKAAMSPTAAPPRAAAGAASPHTLPPLPEAAAFDRLCPTPLTELPGVGPTLAKKLMAAGILDLGDLLVLRPRKYQDRRAVTPIVELGECPFAVVQGTITRAASAFGGAGRRFLMDVTDETGTVGCAFFRVNTGFASRTWTVGSAVTISGAVTKFRERLQMTHPTVDLGAAASDERSLRPVYPEIEGVGERVVRRLVRAAVEGHADELPESLPEAVRQQTGLPTWAEAVRRVHLPPADAHPADFLAFRDPALRRFIFDELITLQLALGLRRRTREKRALQPVSLPPDLDAWLRSVLPFEPTGAQRRVIGQLARDLSQGRPLNRLLQGDVGSGKTAVAYALARLMQREGYQTALMAPTEVLAQQHLRTLGPLFAAAGLRAALLTAGMPKREQRLIRELTLAGAVHCLMGTHSLLSENLGFARLGLAIVDEQHRFGVRQRLALRQKAIEPHLLVMTATPIPRSLALTAYGDLDLCVLDELPPGRTPVKTTMHRRAIRDEVYSRVRALVGTGCQAYVVFPLVEESETMDLTDATSAFEALSTGAFADLRVALVHGRMATAAKDDILRTFAEGGLDVLVTTTVIEVGIDVANATVMVIEHAERFGLSQLHQLRGRVGRGGQAGYCLLLCDEQPTEDALARLKVMVSTNDGFVVAQADLEQRGPGEVLGTKQAGVTDLVEANLVRDASLIELAREVAQGILEADPTLAAVEHSVLRRMVWSKWGEKLELVEAG